MGFLSRFLAHDPARPALKLDGRWFTYGELRERAEGVAGWLREQGVEPGDRVAIQMENGLPLVDAHLGCMALGAIRVPLNVHYKAAELAPILEDAAPRLLLRGPPGMAPPVSEWPGAREGGAASAAPTGPRTEITAWLFTSGTTGRPKGAPQSWAMWEANLDSLARRWALEPDDRLWLTLPLFHTHGLVLGLHGTLLRGASAIVESRFDPAPPPTDATHFYGVPTLYHRWLPSMRREDFRRIKLLVSGSDGMPAAMNDAVFAATGHRVLERYGMTETVIISSNPYSGERRAGTVGTALDNMALRIAEDGEVQVRGASVFGGYHPRQDPDAFTADGWFRTGDAGAFDEAGYLRIVGRLKELIIVGGVNVSPAEVERHLTGTPGVREVGVCGLPDADLNEIVAAVVVPDGSVGEADLRAALEARGKELSGLKRPRKVLFSDALPRNALGKLQRGALRRLFQE